MDGLDARRSVSIWQLGRGHASQAVRMAQEGPVMILSNSKPAAILLSIDDYERLQSQQQKDEEEQSRE